MHPVMELFEQKSNKLSGKKIVIGITGSIAAVECVKLIHDLIRHGASVYPVMTSAACKIIDPEAIHYASGRKTITHLTGGIEHVALCGQVKDHADLLLIVPSTANTISKIACGIDDTTVTTFATTAIGSKIPIIIVPAMHGSMYEHSIIKDNIKKLKESDFNIQFIEPSKSENKYKLPSIKTITAFVIRTLWKPVLTSKQILIIGGSTIEPIDDMRVISNKSTGSTGVALANAAFMAGGDVTLWLGGAEVETPEYINSKRFRTVDELNKMANTIGDSGKNYFDIIIVCAAISDYTIKQSKQGKIPSGKKKIKLDLIPTPKIIEIIRKRTKNTFLVGYKAESRINEKSLIEKAFNRLIELNLDMIIANDLAKVTRLKNQIYIIHPNKTYKRYKANKEYLAECIFDEILSND